MEPLDAMVKAAIDAFKAGRKQEARDKLMEVIERNERHEQAWLWLSGMVEQVEEQRICLENVLAINPDNERAQKGLGKLQGQAPPPPAPSQPSAATGSSFPDSFDDIVFESFDAAPASSSGPSSAKGSEEISPFGDISIDEFVEPASDSNGQSDAGAQEFVQPTSSVDWGPPGETAFHGSGRNVDLPSADQYDEWVAQLNIGEQSGDDASASSTKGSGSTENAASLSELGFEPGDFGSQAFGDDASSEASSAWTSSPVDDSAASGAFDSATMPWDSAPSAFSSSPGSGLSQVSDSFGSETGFGFDESSPFESGDAFAVEDLYSAAPTSSSAEPQGGSAFETSFDFGGGSALDEDLPSFLESPVETVQRSSPADDDDDLVFNFDDVDDGDTLGDQADDDEWLDSEFVAVPVGGTAAGSAVTAGQASTPNALSSDASTYFQYIPGEIEASSAGFSLRSMLLLAGVVLLLVLNMVSFGVLIVRI